MKLIDATPLIDECKECMSIEWNRNVYTTWAEAEEDFKDRLEDAPIVDAVEVSDYNSIEDKLECLLCHATGGKFSKASYSFADMERMVTDYIEECCEEAVAEEVVHGRWDAVFEYEDFQYAHCSVCGKRSEYMTKFCPNCGAKMDGDGNG